MDTATAALVSASLATTGWLYAARRARALSRKQHTVNVLIQAGFNKEFQEIYSQIRPLVKEEKMPNPIDGDPELVDAVRRVLNHYEFIAAGLRNGDFDEPLVKDTERSTIVNLYSGSKKYIWTLRNDRNRMSLYEHLEWLHARWTDASPRRIKSACEWARQRPFQGARHNYKKSVAD